MAIVNMKKMHLLGLKLEQDMLLGTIQKTGAVEVIDITQQVPDHEVQQNPIHQGLEKELSELDSKLGRFKFGIDFLKPFVKEKNPLLYGRPNVQKQELDDMLSGEEQYLMVIQAISELDQRLTRLKGEESKLRSRIELLSSWAAMDIPLEELGPTRKTEFLTVVVPAKVYEDFKNRLAEKEIPAEVINVGGDRDETLCLLVYYKSQKAGLQDVMKEFSVNIQEFPGLKGTPREIIAGDEKRLSDMEAERQSIRREAQALADQRFALEVLYDYWSTVRDKKRNSLKMTETEKTFFLTAWVPEPLEDKIKQRILAATDAVYIEFSPPEEGEQIPVMVENPRLVKPFELITQTFIWRLSTSYFSA